MLGTYKVVRAVSEVEAIGYFDCLNAYDRAFISLGPCHWTAGLAADPAPETAVDKSEPWGFVSYLKESEGDRPVRVRPGDRPLRGDIATDWDGDGAELFNPSQRTYADRPTIPREGGGTYELRHVEEYDTFRGWHSARPTRRRPVQLCELGLTP